MSDKQVHFLKCDTLWFDQVLVGIKPFELRFNDRDYRTGDILVLTESGQRGRQAAFEVMSMVTSDDGPWLQKGHVALGIRRLAINDGKPRPIPADAIRLAPCGVMYSD